MCIQIHQVLVKHTLCTYRQWKQFLYVCSFLIAATTWYTGFFKLSFVTRFACDMANLRKFGYDFHLRSSPSAFSGYGWSVDQLITSLLTSPCSRNPTRSKQLSTVAVLGFQFGCYRVVVPLSFLRSISLASLSSSLSIFGWWDRLKILRNLAAFSFAVLCIIVFILKLLGFVRCLSHEFSFDHI